MGVRFEKAGFVDDAREVFDNALAGEFLGFGDADERDVGAAEEFFHVFGVAAGVFAVVALLVVDLDGTDRAESALVTEDEIDGLMLDKAVGLVATLGANFMVKESVEADVGDDVEFLAEKFIQKLEATALGAGHEVFAGAIVAVFHDVALATTNSDAGEDGD